MILYVSNFINSTVRERHAAQTTYELILSELVGVKCCLYVFKNCLDRRRRQNDKDRRDRVNKKFKAPSL